MMNKSMNKVSKLAAVALLTAGVTIISVPVLAGPLVKTEDNMITMELPDNEWHELDTSEEEKDEMIFTNGKASISIRKFTEDELKDIDVQEAEYLMKFRWADEDYDSIFQLTYSEEKELYVITAAVEDKENLPEVYKALQTIEFDILPEEAKEAAAEKKEHTIETADVTMYAVAASGLNIRKGYDTTTAVIGTYNYAEQVHVTGYVKCNGEKTGWCRIEKDGKEGFVSGKSLSADKPKEEKKDSLKPAKELIQGKEYTTKVDSGYLALRNDIETDSNNEIGPLWNGSKVIVSGDRVGDFVMVAVTHTASGEFGEDLDGRVGYVNANYLYE